MLNTPFKCTLCGRCNEKVFNACYAWSYKWLSKPVTAFEFSRMLYNNSWRLFWNAFKVPHE